MKLSKLIIKPGIMLVAMSAILCAGATRSNANPKNYKQAALKLPKISISITIGRAKKKCGGFGLCKITFGSITAASKRTVRGELTANADGTFQLNLLDKAPDEGQTLFVDQDIVLSRTGATRLGYKAVTIRQGEYAFADNKSLLNARATR